MRRTSYKPTVVVLGLVGLILLTALGLGGWRLYERFTGLRLEEAPPSAPTVAAPATLAPPTQTPIPATPEWQRVREGDMDYYVPPPADEAELRAAFAAIMGHTQVVTGSVETLLAFDRAASRAQVAPLLAEGYEWGPLSTNFIFVDRAWGPDNPIRCLDTMHCEVSRAKLYTEAVIIFDADICTQAQYETTPCLVPLLEEHQIDGRYHLLIVQFVKEADGVWRASNIANHVLPDPPTSP